IGPSSVGQAAKYFLPASAAFAGSVVRNFVKSAYQTPLFSSVHEPCEAAGVWAVLTVLLVNAAAPITTRLRYVASSLIIFFISSSGPPKLSYVYPTKTNPKTNRMPRLG